MVPAQPKLYHIVHVDRLPSIIQSNALFCDAVMAAQTGRGTTIGMDGIKRRRLKELKLASHPELYVGQCVPFYFCPRSIMLFLIHKASNPELTYRGGQGPIVHLEADLHTVVENAKQNGRRWAFTLSNAGGYLFEDRADLAQLHEINWDAVRADRWSGTGVDPAIKDGKQAEFLVEHSFPWWLVERIGVRDRQVYQRVMDCLPAGGHRPTIELRPDWYY